MVIPGEETQVTKCQVVQHDNMYLFLVRGDANFIMSLTMLTVGGFTQPSVARSLIEQPSNSEKGLSSRFLWFFPNVLYGTFDDLGQVNPEFINKLSMSLRQYKLSCLFVYGNLSAYALIACLLCARKSMYMNVGACVWSIKHIRICIVNLNIGTLFVNQWRKPAGQDKEVEHKIFKLPKSSTVFKDYYDDVQGSLKSLAGMDDFLTG